MYMYMYMYIYIYILYIYINISSFHLQDLPFAGIRCQNPDFFEEELFLFVGSPEGIQKTR